MTLTDFLLARIAEDEAVARKSQPLGGDDSYASWVCCEFMHVAIGEDRMLAECEAKRHLAEMVAAWVKMAPGGPTTIVLVGLARHAALPYADHPDYREEWKP